MAEAQKNDELVFDSPPVEEVALSVYFPMLGEIQPLQFGLFWQEIRDQFPKIEEHPYQPPTIEQMNRSPQQAPTVYFLGGVPERRFRFRSDDGSRLVQVQRDLLTFNWIKISEGQEYPRYQGVRQQLEDIWNRFVAFIGGLGGKAPSLLQVEISYVNAVPKAEGWQGFPQLALLIAPWSGALSAELPDVETVAIQSTTMIPNGRLYLGANPWTRARDKQESLAITITSRVLPEEGEDMRTCLDRAHFWARRGFVALTTNEAHEMWRRVR